MSKISVKTPFLFGRKPQRYEKYCLMEKNGAEILLHKQYLPGKALANMPKKAYDYSNC